MPPATQQLITASQLGTHAGLTLVVFVITNAFRDIVLRYLKIDAKAFALAISLILNLVAAFTISASGSGVAVDFLLGIANGCLIYLTAIGGTATVALETPQQTSRTRAIVDEPGPGGSGDGGSFSGLAYLVQWLRSSIRPW